MDDPDQELAGSMLTAVGIVRAFAVFNPHATFRLTLPGRPPLTFPARRPDYPKWKTDSPSSPHWYTVDRLQHLIATLVGADRAAGGPVRTVRRFMADFRGLTGSKVQKAVYEQSGLTAVTLADLFPDRRPDRPQIARLLAAMCGATGPPNPAKLGPLGRPTFADGLRLFGADGQVRYAMRSGTADGLPWVLEVGLGVRPSAARRVVAAGV